MLLTDHKTCTECGEGKPLADFHRMASSGDGHRPSCKSCRCRAQRVYQDDRVGENRSRCSAHYELNREQRLEEQRKYYSAHVAEIAARQKRDSKARADRQQRREALKKQVCDEYVDRMVVFERDQGICGICNEEATVDDFHVDHVVPLSKGGRHSYNNVQVAHPSCNMAKRNRVGFTLPAQA